MNTALRPDFSRAAPAGIRLKAGASIGLFCLLITAGCGGSNFDYALVGSDPAVAPSTDPASDDGLDRAPIPVPYEAGEQFRTDIDADSVTVLLACKSENERGFTTSDERRMRFEPATGAFFVDGGRVLDTGFVWNVGLNEFVASRVVPIGTASGQYDAKVTLQGRPTYYRYKLILQDFSFQQTECFEGVNG